MTRSFATAFLVSFLLIGPSARAQVPPVPDIPKQVIVPGDRARLEKLRSDLVQQLSALQANAAALKAKCTGVENGSSLYDECAGDQSKVEAEKQAYIDAVTDFKNKLEPPSPLTGHVAAIASIRGEVHIITANGTDILASSGTPVPLDGHPRIATGPEGQLKLLLPDETVFTLGPDANMVIDEFVYDPNSASGRKITTSLLKGALRFVTGKVALTNPQNVKVKLLVGDLGFRGTDCETYVAPDHSGYVKLYSGKLDINPTNAGVPFTLENGQQVSFTSDGVFSQPVPLGGGISRKVSDADRHLAFRQTEKF